MTPTPSSRQHLAGARPRASALLLCVWVHGCIGIHYWLRLAPWYAQARQILFALAVALPVTALAGFSVAGRQVAAQIAEPGELERLPPPRAPMFMGARLVTLRDRLQHTFLARHGGDRDLPNDRPSSDRTPWTSEQFFSRAADGFRLRQQQFCWEV